MTSITASAPGRVNLIGEHTDYNDGFVLPTPIPQRTTAVLRPRSDRTVRVVSHALHETAEYELGREARRGGWLDYIMGCTHALSTAGQTISGFDVEITSDVPLGSGLSSSASLEIAVLRAVRQAFSLSLDDTQLALLGQRAENEIVGAPVGIMDQLCVSRGEPGAALFVDTRTLEVMTVPLPPDLDLIVVASGLQHDHATGDYKTRRAECERAAEMLGVTKLRDVTDPAVASQLPAPLDRRVRHVVTENARVLAAVEALRAHDLAQLGALFVASHASMRDDYECSLPAIDQLVEHAAGDPDVYGARMTGGGFGGSIVVIARSKTAKAVAARLTARVPSAHVLVAEAACVPS